MSRMCPHPESRHGATHSTGAGGYPARSMPPSEPVALLRAGQYQLRRTRDFADLSESSADTRRPHTTQGHCYETRPTREVGGRPVRVLQALLAGLGVRGAHTYPTAKHRHEKRITFPVIQTDAVRRYDRGAERHTSAYGTYARCPAGCFSWVRMSVIFFVVFSTRVSNASEKRLMPTSPSVWASLRAPAKSSRAVSPRTSP